MIGKEGWKTMVCFLSIFIMKRQPSWGQGLRAFAYASLVSEVEFHFMQFLTQDIRCRIELTKQVRMNTVLLRRDMKIPLRVRFFYFLLSSTYLGFKPQQQPSHFVLICLRILFNTRDLWIFCGTLRLDS